MWTLLLLLACTGSDDGDAGAGGSPTCDLYLDCVSAVTPNDLDDAITAYGNDGSCWGEGLDCDAACEDGLEDLRPLEFHEDCYDDELDNDCYVAQNAVELCEQPNSVEILQILEDSVDCTDVDLLECYADAVRECAASVVKDVVYCE